MTLTLGSGSGVPAQSCTAVTSSTGAASCTVPNVNQPVGPVPVTVSYAGTSNYQPTSTPSTVQVGPATTSSQVTVSAASGSYGSPVTVSATLIDTYTGSGAANEPVTFTLGTQHCTGTTNASGVASCSITPTGPAGTYTLTASFSGDSTLLPVLLANTGSNTFTETTAPTTLTYTGSTSVTSGKAPSLSAVLTTSTGTPLAGQTVTFTVGTGSSAQKCSGTTNASGAVSCSICMFNQSASPLPVTVTYGGTLVLRRDDRHGVGHRHRADHPVGERGDRRLRPVHHDHGDADQLGDRHAHQRPDHHADAERDAVVHRHHSAATARRRAPSRRTSRPPPTR